MIRKIIQKVTLVLTAVVFAFLSQTSVYAFDEMFTIGNDIYYYNPSDTCTPTGASSSSSPAGTSTGDQVQVTLAQANIKKNYGATSQAARYKDAMELFSSQNPDFVTLNEIHTPSDQLKYRNYEVLGKQHPDATTTEDEGVRIAWDTDRWKKVDDGIEMIHPSTPGNSIAARDRYATWGVFQNTSSNATISVISTHWNVGSEKRPDNSKKAGENLKTLAQSLLSKGPVLIGGDFNFPLSEYNLAHSPAQILKPIGLKSAFGKPADKDVNIDSIFYPEQFTLGKKQTYSKSKTNAISDHPFIVASFSGNGGASVTDSTGCICKSTSSITSLTGNKNDEKVYNYFLSKGLSPVQSAGIVGNIAVESNFDPERIQGKDIGDGSKNPRDAGSSGWGLIQWTPGAKVLTAAKEAGLGDQPIYELSTQLDLIWAHMHNKPGITKGTFSVEDYKKITDLEKAVFYFEDQIEGAGEPNYPDRYAAARLALDEYGGGSTSTRASIDSCDAVGDGAAAGNAVQTAINYAWSDYRPKGSAGALTLKPSYKKAVEEAQAKDEYVGGTEYPGVDCGGFITLVMKNSGVDTKYGAGGNTTAQLNYLITSGKYKEIKNPTTADMVPGAIAIKAGDSDVGHTYMYVGDNPGFETKVASASLDGRAPMAGMEVAADHDYRWFVLK